MGIEEKKDRYNMFFLLSSTMVSLEIQSGRIIMCSVYGHTQSTINSKFEVNVVRVSESPVQKKVCFGNELEHI